VPPGKEMKVAMAMQAAQEVGLDLERK